MSSTYNKPHLSFDQQLALLKNRGLEVSDDALGISYLGRIGYYRLSAYLYPMRAPLFSQDATTQKIKVTRQDQFIPGTKFDDALEMYVFDKRLRLLLLDAIERIEVTFRVDISYVLGSKDTFAHTNPCILHGNFTKKKKSNGLTAHQEWLAKYEKVLKRSKEDLLSIIKINMACHFLYGYLLNFGILECSQPFIKVCRYQIRLPLLQSMGFLTSL